MLKIEVTETETRLDMHGNSNQLANDMLRALKLLCKKLIGMEVPEDRKELAATLATGWVQATREALKEVRGND
ncbi:MAG: hypothetical protein J6S92_00855 [Oscillospiraceae bacterium]|nr:hypothetical protein [Oscillospiraceae bacterium]MBP0986817.1 hypothetical protein [Oscillospiraceae bacterium]